jgi:hypothetical protein
MSRFFAPQRASGASIFAIQSGTLGGAVALEAGPASTAAPVSTTQQLKLDREFLTIAAPSARTIMLEKSGDPAV